MAAITLARLSERLFSDPALRKVKSERLTYLSDEKIRRLMRAADASRGQKGDILEFGVALGGSGVLLAKKARARGSRFVGFDVFGMIPAPTSEHDDGKSKQRYEVIASGRSQGIGGETYYGYRSNLYAEVCDTFQRYGVPVDGRNVLLVKGLFEETWPTFERQPVALAHIDCDWYEPVKFCLEAVAPLLLPRGVIVLDDYNDYGGCRTAVDQFLEANPAYAMEPGENPILRRRSTH